MSGVTEIYLCKPGQGLKEGKLETSRISTKDEAACDAEQRCRLDPTLDRIAYYAIDENGGFRNFFTYKNPNPLGAGKKPVSPARGTSSTVRPASVSVRRPDRSTSLIRRLRAVFEED